MDVHNRDIYMYNRLGKKGENDRIYKDRERQREIDSDFYIRYQPDQDVVKPSNKKGQ